MAADPRILRLKIALEDTNQNPYFKLHFESKDVIEYLRAQKGNSGMVFRAHPENEGQYFLTLKVNHKPFVPSDDILVELTKDGYVLTAVDGKYCYPTLEAFLLACRNFSELGDNNNTIPPADEMEIARAYFEDRFRENPDKEIVAFLNQNKLTMEMLFCNISLELMQEPMLGPEGLHYDKKNIEEWLLKNGTSPNSRKAMTMKEFELDIKVLQAIQMIIKRSKEPAKDLKEVEEQSKLKSLLFSKDLQQELKLAKDLVVKLAAPTYDYDFNRNLFNLVVASENCMDQLVDQLINHFPVHSKNDSKGFRPRIALEGNGNLIINFSEATKSGKWPTAQLAAIKFLEGLVNAGLLFDELPIVSDTRIIFKQKDVIKFASFCKMPEDEIQFMYESRGLLELFNNLKKPLGAGAAP